MWLGVRIGTLADRYACELECGENACAVGVHVLAQPECLRIGTLADSECDENDCVAERLRNRADDATASASHTYAV